MPCEALAKEGGRRPGEGTNPIPNPSPRAGKGGIVSDLTPLLRHSFGVQADPSPSHGEG